MDKKEIQLALKAKELNFSMMAEALGVKPKTVISVTERTTRSRRVAQALAKAIEQPIKKVFPDIPEYHTNTPVSEIKRTERKQKVDALRELVA